MKILFAMVILTALFGCSTIRIANDKPRSTGPIFVHDMRNGPQETIYGPNVNFETEPPIYLIMQKELNESISDKKLITNEINIELKTFTIYATSNKIGPVDWIININSDFITEEKTVSLSTETYYDSATEPISNKCLNGAAGHKRICSALLKASQDYAISFEKSLDNR